MAFYCSQYRDNLKSQIQVHKHLHIVPRHQQYNARVAGLAAHAHPCFYEITDQSLVSLRPPLPSFAIRKGSTSAASAHGALLAPAPTFPHPPPAIRFARCCPSPRVHHPETKLGTVEADGTQDVLYISFLPITPSPFNNTTVLINQSHFCKYGVRDGLLHPETIRLLASVLGRGRCRASRTHVHLLLPHNRRFQRRQLQSNQF